jgi:hypothetical protein
VRGDVGELARAVSRGSDDRAFAGDDRADRNLATLSRRFRLAKRDLHEACRLSAHLDSRGSRAM